MIPMKPSPRAKHARLLSVLAATCLALSPLAAMAQQMGKTPWDSAPRSASLAAQFQFQKKYGSGSAAGMDALTQYVTNYNSSSTSIGNYTEVVQTLGDGATGTVTQSATQDSSGTQDATADAHDNQTTNGSFNATAAGKGKGDRNASATGAAGQPNQ
jgi:hypothetical protein